MDHQALLTTLLAAIGTLVVAAVLRSLLKTLYFAFLRPAKDLKRRYGDNGWVVVTGATDGIGKAVAFNMARRGMNVYLISRSVEKLAQTKSEIGAKYPRVSIEIEAVDYNDFTPQKRGELKEKLSKLSGSGLAVLVNNVGISYDYPMYFNELDEARVGEILRLNIDSTTYMTRLALEVMLNKKLPSPHLYRGAIINIGSSSGLMSTPLLSEYSAAKAYIERFSEGLAREYASKKIDVQVHVPYFIVSKLSKFRRASLFVPSAEQYGKLVCDRVGYETVVQPYLVHSLVGYVLARVPMVDLFILWHHLGIRTKALRKKAGDGGKRD